jgi:hypothetical protein
MFSTLADWLLGCSHRRTSFPITCRAERTETYVVCLECGTKFRYDWTQMRIAKQPVGKGMVMPAANRWFDRLVHHN